MFSRQALVVGFSIGVAACGSDGPPADQVDAAVASDWQPLVTKNWTLAAGEERTSDLEVANLDEDVFVGAIRPISPPGTHHTLLARGLSNTNIIYASGVGTNELTFPAGTGLRLPAGTLLGLQLHIFNNAETELSGMSGIEVKVIDPKTVTQEVDLFLPGPRDLALPPNQISTASGTCTVRAPQTIFAIFPHMHQLGMHLKTTLMVGGVPRVLHDAPYSFEHQSFDAFEPILLAVGDTITTECTWNNTTSQTVTYGESSTTEMCYSILYRYPGDGGEFCTQ
ncbi:MAG: hypothetical protein JWP01_875 [Myxococcales bacterium]|nr:hypothetical protein [Myxococcales bacterium]